MSTLLLFFGAHKTLTYVFVDKGGVSGSWIQMSKMASMLSVKKPQTKSVPWLAVEVVQRD